MEQPSADQIPQTQPDGGSDRQFVFALTLPKSRIGSWWWLVLAGVTTFILARGALSFFWLFARPLAYLFLGTAIAAALSPLAAWLDRWMPRALAVILIYLAILGIFAGIGWLIIPDIVGELQKFLLQIPDLVEPLRQWLNQSDQLNGSAMFDTITSSLTALGAQLLSIPLVVFSITVDVFMVIFLSFYALLDAPGMKRFFFSLVPEDRRIQVQRAISDMMTAMGGYLRGVITSALIIGLFTYLGLWFIGVEFALVLAVIAALFEIVPLVGPMLAGTIIVVVTFLQSPSDTLSAFIFVLILQQLEANIIFPNVVGRETETSPLLNLIAFFAGYTVGGIVGALVAVPLAAALQVFIRQIVAPVVRRWTGVTS